MALSEKEKAFADEYIINMGNAYQAALSAGYSKATARHAADWLNENAEGHYPFKQRVRDYIDERLEEIASQRSASSREVMEYLTAVMRGKSLSVVLYNQEDGMGQATMEKPPDENQRLKAAEILTKVLGMQNNKVDLQAFVPIVISGEDALED